MGPAPKDWKVEELERTIGELTGLAAELDRMIEREEVRARVNDPKHPAYSSIAASASQRLNRLRASISRFEAELKHEIAKDATRES
jgi:hypothetical protein